MSEDVFKVAENNEVRIRMILDTDPDNPRDCVNIGKMVCWHRGHDLGDKHSHSNPRSFLESLAVEMGMSENTAESEKYNLDGLMNYVLKRGVIILPLYLYDHSGITMSTSPFSCPWDSGQVGWIYATPETIRKEYGKRITKKARETCTAYLLSEVKTFDQYLTGDVYGFALDKKTKVCNGACEGDTALCSCDPETCNYEYDEEDSCWGFYGSDPFDNGMDGHIDDKYHPLLKELDYPRN